MSYFGTERLRGKLWLLLFVVLVLSATVVVWAPLWQYLRYGSVPLPDELVKITGIYSGKIETRIGDPENGSQHTGYRLREDSILYVFALTKSPWQEMTVIKESDTVTFSADAELRYMEDGVVFRYLYGVRKWRKVIVDAEETIRAAQSRYYPSGWMWIASIVGCFFLYRIYVWIMSSRPGVREAPRE